MTKFTRKTNILCLMLALMAIASQRSCCVPNPLGDTPELLNTLVIYGADSATQIKPSDIFCGNHAKQTTGPCLSKATDVNGQRPAYERVEIRGWIVDIGGFDGADVEEDEYRFNVLLDHGWTPASPAAERVRPINTAQEVNFAITPHNIIFFGLNNSGSGSAMLTSDGNVWGGAKAAVIHVEVNGWGPARMSSHAPEDWVRLAHDPDVGDVGWPFDPVNPPAVHPGSLQNGDYVRVVGTLWEDEPHIHDGSNEVKDAKRCWNSGSTGQGDFGRGYFEIHPVDFMAKIDPPSNQTEALEVIAMCGTSSLTIDIHPKGPRPSPQSTVGFEEFIDNDFTVRRSIVTHNVRSLNDHIQIEVAVERGGFLGLGPGAKFKAAYRVFWQ